jgi:H+/Cl- antiporter ClcA
MPNPFVAGHLPSAMLIGWSFGSFFHGIVKQFDHIAKHVAAAMGDTLGVAFGIPPGTVLALTELLMHAHAGNPVARKQVEDLAKKPGMKQAMTQLSVQIRQHPHFAHFQAHAQSEGQKAALHGMAGAARRRRVGNGEISGTI